MWKRTTQKLLRGLCHSISPGLHGAVSGPLGHLNKQYELKKEVGARGGAHSPQRAVPLAHADAAQDLFLVCLSLPQVFTHDVTAQAKAHDDQLGQGVCLLDVVHHGSEFPGAACGQKGKGSQSCQVRRRWEKM